MIRDRVGRDPVLRQLLAIGFVSFLPYLLVIHLSRSFRYGEGHETRPILAVVGLFLLAWLGYALALKISLGASNACRERKVSKNNEEHLRLVVVLGFSVAFRLMLLVSTPIQEIDYYRYLWDGRLLLNGINPYRYAPAEIDLVETKATADSVLQGAWQLSQRSDSVRTMFERIHHREVPTIYPPFSQLVFAIAAWLVPPELPLWAHVLVLKTILVGFDLGVVLGLAALLARVGLPPSWCLSYGWCPLVLKEVANTAHLDAIAVCLSVLAAYVLVDATNRDRPKQALRAAVLGSALLAVATLAKSYPLILLPIIGSFLVAHLRMRAIIAAAVFLLVLAIGYAPFIEPQGSAGDETGHSPWTGFATFMKRWQKNDLIFMLVYENIRLHDSGHETRWFVVVPDPIRRAISERVARPLLDTLGTSEADPAFILTQILMGGIVATLIVWYSVMVYRRPVACALLHGIALVLVWGWLLSATPHPWYLTWCLPFLIFAGRRSWFVLTATSFIYYLRFWMEYKAIASGPEAVDSALDQFDYEVIWLVYAPLFVAMLIEGICGFRRKRSNQL